MPINSCVLFVHEVHVSSLGIVRLSVPHSGATKSALIKTCFDRFGQAYRSQCEPIITPHS